MTARPRSTGERRFDELMHDPAHICDGCPPDCAERRAAWERRRSDARRWDCDRCGREVLDRRHVVCRRTLRDGFECGGLYYACGCALGEPHRCNWPDTPAAATDLEAVELAYDHPGTTYLSLESGDRFEHAPHTPRGCICEQPPGAEV